MFQIPNASNGIQKIEQAAHSSTNSSVSAIPKKALEQVGQFGTALYLIQGVAAQNGTLTNSTSLGTDVITGLGLAAVLAPLFTGLTCYAIYQHYVKSAEFQPSEQVSTDVEVDIDSSSTEVELDPREDANHTSTRVQESSPLKNSPNIDSGFSTQKRKNKKDDYEIVDLDASAIKKHQRDTQSPRWVDLSDEAKKMEKTANSSCIIS